MPESHDADSPASPASALDPVPATQPAAAHAAAASMRGRPRWLVPLAVLLAVVAVAFAAVGALFGLKLHDARGGDAARAHAVDAARQQAVDFTTVDYEHLDAYVQQVLDGSTDPFRAQFSGRAADLKKAFAAAKVQATGDVLDAGVASAGKNSAVVLAIVDETIKNTAAPKGQITRYRMKLTLHREHGRWLLADLFFPQVTGDEAAGDG